MSPTNDAAAFVGRLLLSVIFVLSGFQKLAEFSGTVAFMGSEGLPLPLIAAIVAILVECVGGTVRPRALAVLRLKTNSNLTTGIEYDGNGRVDSVNRTGSCHSIADRNNYGNRPAEEVGR